MTNGTTKNYEGVLDALYIVRQLLQDIYVNVLKKYPAGSKERSDFLFLKGAVDAAIVDLENYALGGIAKRMAAALPDIKAATKTLKKRLQDLEATRKIAKKVTKALGWLEKALGLFL